MSYINSYGLTQYLDGELRPSQRAKYAAGGLLCGVLALGLIPAFVQTAKYVDHKATQIKIHKLRNEPYVADEIENLTRTAALVLGGFVTELAAVAGICKFGYRAIVGERPYSSPY